MAVLRGSRNVVNCAGRLGSAGSLSGCQAALLPASASPSNYPFYRPCPLCPHNPPPVLQCVLTPAAPYMPKTNEEIVAETDRQVGWGGAGIEEGGNSGV